MMMKKTTLLTKTVGVFGLLAASIGAAHACTLPKSDFKNLKCTTTSDMYVAFRDNGSPVALVNKSGKKVVDLFAYDAVLTSQFHAGLLPVRKGNKIGYINRAGRVVVPIIYDSFGGSQWARGVSAGKIVVKKEGQLLTLNTSGQVIGREQPKAEPKKSEAKTEPKKADPKPTQAKTEQKSEPKKSEPKKTGKPVAKTTQNPAHNNPKWADDNFFAHKQGNKWGYINRAGTPMIVYAFEEAAPFSEGLAGVRMDGKWGFITPAGDLVIDFRFNDKGIAIMSRDVPELVAPFVFKDGRAWVGNLKDGKKLCIDKLGKNVDCQTGQPLNDKPANALIEALENLPILLPTDN